MCTMSETTGRAKTAIIAVLLFVGVAAATGYIATQWGANRAVTLLVALALVAGLVWLVLTVVSILTATSVRRERADEAWKDKDEQVRQMERRTIILPEDRPQPGRRRRNPDA